MQLAKAGFHQPLKGNWCIGEPKRHPFTLPVRGFASNSNSTCQYSDLRSNVENQMAQWRQSMMSSILSNSYQYSIVLLFSLHGSIQNQSSLSFFLTTSTTLAHCLKLFLIVPTSPWTGTLPDRTNLYHILEMLFHLSKEMRLYATVSFLEELQIC